MARYRYVIPLFDGVSPAGGATVAVLVPGTPDTAALPAIFASPSGGTAKNNPFTVDSDAVADFISTLPALDLLVTTQDGRHLARMLNMVPGSNVIGAASTEGQLATQNFVANSVNTAVGAVSDAAIGAVMTAAGPKIQQATDAATAAGTSATNAKTSETNAKTSETNAATSAGVATAAAATVQGAAASATNAKTSETNAKTSETNSANSANSANAAAASAQGSAAGAAIIAAIVGIYPAPYATVLPQGVNAPLTGGTGTGTSPAASYNTGPYSFAVAGGPAGFAATYTIDGAGKMGPTTITNPGLSTANAVPVLSIQAGAAGGNLTGATAPTAVVGSLVPVNKGYWVQSSDGLLLVPYTNIAGAPTPSVGISPIATDASSLDLPLAVSALIGGASNNPGQITRPDGTLEVVRIQPRFVGAVPLYGMQRRSFGSYPPGIHFKPGVGQSKWQGTPSGGRYNIVQRYGLRALPWHGPTNLALVTNAATTAGATGVPVPPMSQSASASDIATGMLISGAGIAPGTAVKGYTNTSGTTTLLLSQPTTADMPVGTALTLVTQLFPLVDTTVEVNGFSSYSSTQVGYGGPMHGVVYLGERAEKRDGVVLDQVKHFIVVANNASGGTSIAQNAWGGSTGNAERVVSQVAWLKGQALKEGLPFYCRQINFSQGEGGTAGYAGQAAYTYDGYKTAFKVYAIDMDSRIRAITGDPATKPVYVFAVQTNTRTGTLSNASPTDDYPVARAQLDAYRDSLAAPVAGVTAVATAAAAAGSNTLSFAATVGIVAGMLVTSGAALTTAQARTVQSATTANGTTTVTLSGNTSAALANGDTVTFRAAQIICVTPEYMVRSFFDALHYPTPEAYWLDAYLELAAQRTINEGVPWVPLTFNVDSTVGNYVFLRATGAVGQLVIDTTSIPAQDDPAQGMLKGYKARDASGNIVAVTSVDACGAYIRVGLASAPAGLTLSYACNVAVNRGPYQGGAGNIRDSLGDDEPPYDGNGVWRRMDKWAMAQQWSL